MFFPVLLAPARPSELLPHPDWEILLWIAGAGVLLVVSLTIYIVSAIRSRGKPKPKRLSYGNFGGLAGSGRGPGQGNPAGSATPPGSSPGAFALFGRKSPYGPYGDNSPPEDPRKR